jgi:opacity protein-like surface antigen
MKKLLITTIATIALLPAFADASEMGKSYFSINGEANFGSDSHFSAVQLSSGDAGKTQYNIGFGGGLAIGHYPTNYIRTELALDFRHTDMKHVVIAGTRLSQDDFASNVMDGMLNVYFDLYDDQMYSPYVGGGLGMAREWEDGKDAFAYQLMAGLNINAFKEGTFFVGYKYFATSNFKSGYNDPNLGRVKTKATIRDHIVEVGYRFIF